MKRIRVIYSLTTLAVLSTSFALPLTSHARTFDDFQAHPPIHALAGTSATPQGLTPKEVKAAYKLPGTGGAGTIAIIDAYGDPNMQSDLAAFDKAFSLASCTTANKCLQIHQMSTAGSPKTDDGWAMETALDVEWAHAIAPKAKILLVEAAGASGGSLLSAVDYARNRKDVVAISMSWGGGEFSGETALDSHFKASHPITFVASSGDDGTGASWPAVSPEVVAVGGTSLVVDSKGTFVSEKAWTGSGGGVSAYEAEPQYQIGYSIPRADKMRAIPDVSFAADPAHGFSVYHANSGTTSKAATKNSANWYMVGGTSAGAPQWAAIAALGVASKHNLALSDLYIDKSGTKNAQFFRDITSGNNGTCAYYCTARAHYDYVTGLGSPMTYKF